MDVPGVLGALRSVGYDRLVTVELSRDSHRAHTMVPEALRWLREAERSVERTAAPVLSGVQ
jgi:ribosomal protein S12 methylthiotransferase accessory factor